MLAVDTGLAETRSLNKNGSFYNQETKTLLVILHQRKVVYALQIFKNTQIKLPCFLFEFCSFKANYDSKQLAILVSF